MADDENNKPEEPTQPSDIRPVSITDEMKRSYLDYAMSVIVARAGVDDRLMVQALIEGAMALRFLGRNLAAEQRLRHAWDLCQQRVLPESALQVGTTLARVLVSMGRLAEAADLVGECAALGSRVSDVTPVRAFGVTVTWLLELSTGSWQRAAAELRAAAGAEPNPHFRMHAHLERATILSRADPGREEEAVRESVAATLADARAAGCRRCQAEALLRCAQSLARVGDVRVAEDLAARAEVNRVDAHALFWARWAEATIAAAAHDPGAGDALDGVVVEARRQDMHLEGLWARLDHARVLLESDRGRAVDVLTRACSDAEQMGATTELGLARRLVRSAGVRAWRRAPHAGGREPGGPAHGAGTGDRPARRDRGEQPRDRQRRVPLAQDGRAPRVEHPDQARAEVPLGAGRADDRRALGRPLSPRPGPGAGLSQGQDG